MSKPVSNNNRKKRPQEPREKPEFEQHIADLARVTRVTSGGKQLSFRACVLIGDRKGRVGYGIDKGKDVQIAVEKAVKQAQKNIIRVPVVFETIPHRVERKFKAARLMIKPAPKGSGIIAGSVVRTILDLAGVPNASAKVLGKTNNKITNIKAVFDALQSFKPAAVEKAKKMQARESSKDTREAAPAKVTDEKAAKKPAERKPRQPKAKKEEVKSEK